MSFQLTITIDDSAFLLRLDELEAALAGEHHNILTAISLTSLAENQQRHRDEIAPDGTKWADLKPATIAKKTDSRKLVEKHDLLRFYSTVVGDSVRVGTVDKKAFWHQHGTSRMPARPIFGVSEEEKELIEEEISDYIQIILDEF